MRLCSERLGTESYTHIVEPGFEIPAGSLDGIQEDLRRLSGGEPLQYILGYQEFCGRRFRVGPGVLIPRPETEELVRAALEKLPSEGSALDLCTGSGCIAWTLALDRPGARVTAVDISPEALMIASSYAHPSHYVGPSRLCETIFPPVVPQGTSAQRGGHGRPWYPEGPPPPGLRSSKGISFRCRRNSRGRRSTC